MNEITKETLDELLRKYPKHTIIIHDVQLTDLPIVTTSDDNRSRFNGTLWECENKEFYLDFDVQCEGRKVQIFTEVIGEKNKEEGK